MEQQNRGQEDGRNRETVDLKRDQESIARTRFDGQARWTEIE